MLRRTPSVTISCSDDVTLGRPSFLPLALHCHSGLTRSRISSRSNSAMARDATKHQADLAGCSGRSESFRLNKRHVDATQFSNALPDGAQNVRSGQASRPAPHQTNQRQRPSSAVQLGTGSFSTGYTLVHVLVEDYVQSFSSGKLCRSTSCMSTS